MVARGRNVLLAKFMEDPKNTDLFLIDTDLEFDAADFIRMCKHNVDVVAAAYPYKDDTGQMPLRWPVDGLFEENGLWVVQACTPGFMRITRKAIDLMQRQLPHLAFHDNALGPEGRNWMFFDNACRPNGVYDEGYIFCEKWAQCGGKVYLDPLASITHIGKKAYNHGSAVDWLNRTAENTKKLKHEFPHVPDLDLVGFGAAKKINWEAARAKYGEADSQRNNEGASGAAEENGRVHSEEHDTTEFNSNDLGRHGRSTDPGLAKAIAQRFADISVGTTERRLPGREVRQGA